MTSSSGHTEPTLADDLLASEQAVVLGYNVEHLRKAQGLSKTLFAEMAHISRPTLNKVEYGVSDPKLSLVCRLAAALNVTVPELLTPPDKQAAARWASEVLRRLDQLDLPE